MARRTAAEAGQTRRAILEAGVAYFGEVGYAGAALENLIAAVGVTRGALYHHFGSKRGFFEAVVERVQQRLGEKILRSATRAGDGWAGIEAGCKTFLAAATDPVYRQVAIVDGPSVLGWERWKQIDDAYLTSSLQQALAALHDANETRADDVEALAVALSGAMNELALWVAHHPKRGAALKRARTTIRGLLEAQQRDVS
ncbi:MAG: TetR family transcriptional regulator [Myxococcota bacterium]